MADSIKWLLSADASQVRAEMDRSVAAVNKGTRDMADGFSRVDGSHRTMIRGQERLLESNNRVTNQFAGFSRTLLTARSAADVLSSGLDRLENSTNLSLASGIALAGAAVAISVVDNLRREYEALNKEIDKLTAPRAGGNFQTITAIQSHLEKVTASLAKLREEQGKGFQTSLKDAAMIGAFNPLGGPGPGIVADKRAERIKKLAAQETQDQNSIVDKRRSRSDLRADALAGAPDYAAKARELQIAHDEANTAVHAMTQAAIELDLAFRELAKTVNDKHAERSGMSLKELAAIPEFAQAGMTYEQMIAGQQARKAMELDRQGEAARANFQPELAHSLFNQAGEIKSGMTNLKPSEQMAAEFKGALKVTEDSLREIAEKVTFKRGGE